MFNINEHPRVQDAMTYAGMQYSHALDNDFKGDYVSFEFNGQDIINPFIDPSARFPLTFEEAQKCYGKQNMVDFLEGVAVALGKNTESPFYDRHPQNW